MTRPPKPATSIAQQIDLLRQRGMLVDESLATQWLSNVSYYRLSAYWYPARREDGRGGREDRFVDGTTFSSAVSLYEADRKLRTLVHDGMERIEIAMRTRIGESLYTDGPFSYTQPDRFRPTFNHKTWMETVKKRIRRAKSQNAAIKHYDENYGGRFPFWVLAEVLDFADVSRMLEGLPARDQHRIAQEFGISPDLDSLSKNQRNKFKSHSPLVRWMEQFTIVRNTCAHHGRLWNKSFTPAPTVALRTLPQFQNLPAGQSERIFGTLVVMAHMLHVTSPGTSWPDRIAELLKESFLSNPLVQAQSMGIPTGWDGTLS